MAYRVGTKGQVVIKKAIRDKLGIGPGWLTVQRVEEGHVVIDFVPPEHNRSLKGVLRRYIKRRLPADVDWTKVRDEAWAAAVREEYR